MNIGSLVATIGGDISPLKAAISDARVTMQLMKEDFNNAQKDINAKFKTMGDNMAKVGGKMSTFATLPIAAAGAAAFKYASDMEESTNKVNVAFGKNADFVNKWSESTLQSFGIAKGSARDMASLFGDMSTSMGLSTGEAAQMSTSLVGLAGDLASFKNIGTDQAAAALKGIFTGEGEALKGLGVVMSETTLEQFALSQGIKTQIKDMSQAEKVQLRYAFVMANTKNAQGDFARTSDGAANQMRIFTESLKEVAASFGALLLPIITPVIQKINDLVQWIGSLSETQKAWVIGIAATVAAIGPMLLIIGKVVTLMPTLIAGFNALKAGIAGFKIVMVGLNATMEANPLLIWGVAIAAAVAAIVILWNKVAGFRAVVKYVALSIASFFQKAWLTVQMGAELMWLAIKTYFTAIPKLAGVVWKTIKRVMAGESIGDAFKDEMKNAFEGTVDEAVAIKDKYNAQIAAIESPDFQTILAKEKASDAAKEAGKEIGVQIADSAAVAIIDDKKIETAIRNKIKRDPQDREMETIKGKPGKLSVIEKGSIKDVANVGLEVSKLKEGITKTTAKAKELKQEMIEAAKIKINIGQMMGTALESGAKSLANGLGTFLATRKQYNQMKLDQVTIGQQINALIAEGYTAESEEVAKLQEAYDSLGESINQAKDTSTMQGMFKNILGVVFDFLSQFGEALIAAGFAKVAFDKLITTPGAGVLAIAAGVALLAAVAAAQSALSGGLGGSKGGGIAGAAQGTAIPALASGGMAFGPTLSMIGDNPRANIDPEVVMPLSKLNNYIDGNQSYNMPSEVRLIATGENLQAVLNFRDKKIKNLR